MRVLLSGVCYRLVVPPHVLSLDDLSEFELFGGGAPRSIVPPQQMGERARQQNSQALTPSRISDVDADIASPKESCIPRKLLFCSKGI